MVIECHYHNLCQVEELEVMREVSAHPKEPASICLHV